MSDGQRRGSVLLLAALLLVSIVAVALAAPAASATGESAERQARPEVPHTVAPYPNSTSEIWPYTSRAKSVDSATLPINVVVLADAEVVRNVLILRPDARWENQTRSLNGSEGSAVAPDDEVAPVAVNATGVYWSDADGADRYTYVRHLGSTEGQWIDETFQLHDGDYFGTRYHIRFYEVPDGEASWTALQVHREHFDWFRLRHTVGSLPRAQHYVETQFYGRWYVADLEKRRFTGGGVLNDDGWATVVELRVPEGVRASMPVAALVFGIVALGSFGRLEPTAVRRTIEELVGWRPVSARTLLASTVIAAIPLAVRVASVAVEHAELVDSPKIVAGAFYPFVALGPPLAAYVLFRGVDPGEAFVAAFLALGVGLLADYAYLGIAVVPVEVVVHRAVLLVALGTLAAAGTDRPHDPPLAYPPLLVGASLWVGGLLWTLFLW